MKTTYICKGREFDDLQDAQSWISGQNLRIRATETVRQNVHILHVEPIA